MASRGNSLNFNTWILSMFGYLSLRVLSQNILNADISFTQFNGWCYLKLRKKTKDVSETFLQNITVARDEKTKCAQLLFNMFLVQHCSLYVSWPTLSIYLQSTALTDTSQRKKMPIHIATRKTHWTSLWRQKVTKKSLSLYTWKFLLIFNLSLCVYVGLSAL